MHKPFLYAVLLGFSLPAAATDYAAYQKVAPSVIRVVASLSGAGTSFGSGVVLPGGRVVTNCHVIPDIHKVAVLDAGARIDAQGAGGDASADLCLLQADSELLAPPAQVGRADRLQVGDEVVAIGFGGGAARSISTGRVTGLYPYRDGLVIRTTAAFRQGASGGGLFDRDGNLVGITTFYRRSGSEIAFYAIPVEWIDRLPAPAADALPVANPFWTLAHADQPHFLQVATLEADGKWAEMAEAARLWTLEEPAQQQSWQALSRALTAQGQAVESGAALLRARQAADLAGSAAR